MGKDGGNFQLLSLNKNHKQLIFIIISFIYSKKRRQIGNIVEQA